MDVVYDAVEAFVGFQESGPSLMVVLALTAVLLVPLTLLHEIGHAIAARRVLGTDVEVMIGNAGKLAELQLGQIRYRIHAATTFAGRAGHAGFDDSRARARDVIVIALAGPAASFVGALATGLLLGAVTPGSVQHAVVWVATGVGAMAVVLNLIPFEIRERSGERWRTDGKLALDAYRTLKAVS